MLHEIFLYFSNLWLNIFSIFEKLLSTFKHQPPIQPDPTIAQSPIEKKKEENNHSDTPFVSIEKKVSTIRKKLFDSNSTFSNVKEFFGNDLNKGITSFSEYNNRNKKHNLTKIQCPKCDHEIKIGDSSIIIQCNNLFGCKGKTKLCQNCLVILNEENEDHFEYGYFLPKCFIESEKKRILI